MKVYLKSGRKNVYDKNRVVYGNINRTYLFVILAIYVVIFLVISRNLFSPYLSFDEAGQFWIAKGLNHDSAPMSHDNGLMEVIKNNKYYNLDPGGFSIILHFWTYVSNHYIWLHFLPFLFFIGVVLSFIYLSYIWVKDINIAILMGFIPIFIPVVIHMGFEVRAYSMESLGTVISIIALQNLKDKLSTKRLFLWGCMFSFFMTSRYAEIIVIFIVSVCVIFIVFKSKSTLKLKLILSITYLLPILVTLLYIYFFVLIFHNNNFDSLAYLRYLKNDKSILIEPINLLSLCLIGILTVLFFLRERNFIILGRYKMLLFVSISINILFILFSFLGMYPWSFSGYASYKCISLFLSFGLCFSALLGELLKPLFSSSVVLKYYFIVFLLIFVIFTNKDILFIRINSTNKYNEYKDFMKISVEDFHHIYVDRGATPIVRYLFEYGAFSKKKGTVYPNNFTFTKHGHHSISGDFKASHDLNMDLPIMDELLKYDLVIANRLSGNDKWKLIDGTVNFYIKKN